MKLPWPIEGEGQKVVSPSPGTDAHQIEAKHQATSRAHNGHRTQRASLAHT